MGREIKRVALDFAWPLEVRWKGYINPYRASKCAPCGGTGHNPGTREIAESFYPHQVGGSRARAWHDKITQDEVQALVDAGRLQDYTHVFVPGKGWQPKDPPTVPTAAQINAAQSGGLMLSHDAINRSILVETRAKRLGVYGKCSLCDGSGELWCEPKFAALSEEWERVEPPAGEGWQVWENVSEGSPVTPVFPTAEALIEHLVEHGDAWDENRKSGGWSRANAEAFVRQGHAMSMVVSAGKVYGPNQMGDLERDSAAARGGQ